jgi:ribonuclease P protein component
MLPKKHRLPGPVFSQLKSSGKIRPFKDFGLVYLPNKLTLVRFGLIVSKKIDKRAVIRNRLKRVFREVIRKNLDKFKPGDYLFLVKRSALGIDSKHLGDEICKLLTGLS